MPTLLFKAKHSRRRRLPLGLLSIVVLAAVIIAVIGLKSEAAHAVPYTIFSEIPSLQPIPSDTPAPNSSSSTTPELSGKTVASADAQGVCGDYYSGNQRATNACEFGYDAQTSGLTKSQACSVYPDKATKTSGSQKDCEKGWSMAKAGIKSGQDPAIECGSDKCDFIGKYINPAINVFTAAFGLIAAGSIILGGIQYSTSEGDPQKAANAKKRILNTIIAVVAYIFLYTFLQFLVPGGLFNR